MDSRKRLAIALAITCLIVAAIFASFGRSLFFVQIPSITLADVDGAGSSSSGGSGGQEGDQYWQVGRHSGDGAERGGHPLPPGQLLPGTDGGDPVVGGAPTPPRSSTGRTPAGLTSVRPWPRGRCATTWWGTETAYYWYEGSSTWNSFPADERSADLSQHIPTYETVLELDAASITGTGYELKGTFPSVFVEVQGEDGALERYWISTDNGLLVAAEREVDGTLVYRMTAYGQIQTPCPATASFALPDGQVLHTLS